MVFHKGKITVAVLINGEKITLLRKQKGLDQRDLANAAGVDPSVISRLERNLQDDCMLSVIVHIAEALNVPVDELLIAGQSAIQKDLHPEFQAVIGVLAHFPPMIQQQAAGILRGYVSTLR